MASSISASSAAGKFGWCATALLRPPLNANASYFYQNTYGVTVGWLYAWGTANPCCILRHRSLAARMEAQQQRVHLRADWIPFGKEDSWARPFANLKIGLQYTLYTMFNGGGKNYDGFGRNANGNNMILLYACWLFSVQTRP
jgi:hypothetical protein